MYGFVFFMFLTAFCISIKFVIINLPQTSGHIDRRPSQSDVVVQFTPLVI